MVSDTYAHWLGNQLDALVEDGDIARFFLAKKARVGLMWLERRHMLRDVIAVLVYGSFLSPDADKPNDIDIILVTGNCVAVHRYNDYPPTRNPSYPFVEMYFKNIHEREDYLWIARQLCGSKGRYGVGAVMLCPECAGDSIVESNHHGMGRRVTKDIRDKLYPLRDLLQEKDKSIAREEGDNNDRSDTRHELAGISR